MGKRGPVPMSPEDRKERVRRAQAKYASSPKGRAKAARGKLWRQRRMAALNAYKESNPCCDCGRFFPACAMEFDHLPGTTKSSMVSRLAMAKAEKLQAEMAKCELVCSNCHHVRTWLRLDPSRKDPRVGLSEIN